jgi:hypothetical protein
MSMSPSDTDASASGPGLVPDRVSSSTSIAANDAVERTALKEWAVLVDAMIRGDFCAMIRKGGIREQRAGFSVRHDRFLMYPTFFHEKTEELSPAVRARLASAHAARPPEGSIVIAHLARVRAHWHVTELERLRGIDGEHGLSWQAVESRFHYRNNPGVHVIAVELQALTRPVILPEARRYLGCVSWVELDQAVDVSGASGLGSPQELQTRMSRLHEALGPAAGEHTT